MDFEKFSPIPIVQQKKKYATFTLREVSFRELEEWRAKEKLKEEALIMRDNARNHRIAAFQAEIGQKIDHPTIPQRSWADKVAQANSERKRLAEVEQRVTDTPPWEPLPEPKLTLFQRVKSFLVNIWKSANF